MRDEEKKGGREGEAILSCQWFLVGDRVGIAKVCGVKL